MPGMFSGITILETSEFVAGPYCGKMMAHFGGEVIKVEPPGVGDCSRLYGPFWQDKPHLETSALYSYLNTNKKSITLDWKSQSGSRILRSLIPHVDVAIFDSPPEALQKFDLSYESLKALNSRLIMVCLDDFGEPGPYSHFKAAPIVLSALSGDTIGNGEPDRAPLWQGGLVPYYAAGLLATGSLIAALLHRQLSGQGQNIGISLWDAAILCTDYQPVVFSYTGKESRSRRGNCFPAPVLPCSDGFVVLTIVTEEQWQRVCALMEIQDCIDDPRFATPLLRQEQSQEIVHRMTSWTKSRSRHRIFELALEWRIPVGIVANCKDILEMKHLEERNFFATVHHEQAGPLRMPGAPFRLGKSPWHTPTPAPTLGRDNCEVYGRLLHMSDADLARLRALSVI